MDRILRIQGHNLQLQCLLFRDLLQKKIWLMYFQKRFLKNEQKMLVIQNMQENNLKRQKHLNSLNCKKKMIKISEQTKIHFKIFLCYKRSKYQKILYGKYKRTKLKKLKKPANSFNIYIIILKLFKNAQAFNITINIFFEVLITIKRCFRN